ncbi:hypothetical protein CONLIGDRAFT_666683 [Coniochaeta ligniaria NRRL 30616]|uniref:Uncharacterized protein n=1 Tax=Coniochaeta ligniaria NRRL 30616 TaxID=1408157 RepID=A0A1J7J1X3_9PEZI|nr:hypothetical protein CONLIGDRAFT_666683 [Coniochaeta ligniaria NRRL 30616]
MADHGVIQINRPNGPPRQGGGGPPGGRVIPPPPMHHGGQGQGGVRPIVMNAHPGPRQQNGQNQQMQQNRMMMQPNQGQQQQQLPSLAQERQGMTMLPPQPPRNLVPRSLLEGPVVQISDIRKEPGRLTESEARDELSDFVIFRFERADQANDCDSEGERVTPTWANVVRTEVRGISKKEAARQVRALHDIHRSLGEKKQSLTDAQQRQLEKVLEGLELNERDPRYHYVLVQIDRKLRDKKVRYKSRDRGEIRRHGDRRHGDKHRRYSENRGRRETVEVVDYLGRRRSMVREPRKRVQETVSITAYYKRCPKPEVDAIAMVLQREAENARQLEPPHPHHTFAPQQMQHNQLGMQNQHPQLQGNMAMGMGAGMGMGMPMGMGMGPQQGNKLMGNPNMKGPMNPNNMKNGNNPQVRVLGNKPNGNNMPRKKSPGRQPRSPTSSRESMYSDSDSNSDSDSIETPNSSRSSQSHSHNNNNKRRLSSPTKQHQRRGSRFIEEPTHFGIPPRTMTPHKQRRHDEHRITDEMFPVRRSLPPLAPLPPAPARLSVDLEDIKANAYAAGRADERVDLRERAEVLRPLPRVVQQHPRRSLPADAVLLDDESGPFLPPSPPLGGRLPLRPRVLQHRPSVRLVRPGDVALDEDVIDTLERFRLEDEGVRGRYRDEGRYADDYYDDVILRSERRRVEEARMRDEEFAIDRERERAERARAYLRRADSEGDVLYERDGVDPLNPFAPRPGLARRATVGYGVRGQEYI